jgi:hypothetical protein
MSNDGQLVTAQDALALGRGLSAALTSDQFEDRIRQLIGGVTGQLHSPGFAVMLDNELSEWRKSIEAFAAFCGKGGFRLR